LAERTIISRVVVTDGNASLQEATYVISLRHPEVEMLKNKMLKTVMITTAVSGLLVAGAMAQVTNPPTTTPPMANPPVAKAMNESKFISMQGADKWVFSKFKGTDVLGPDNAHIGDVTDLLFDKNGKVEGVIVGVGGFLGIGEKNVAIELGAFQIVPASVNSTTASRSDDPSNIKLKVSWTKDQLKQAPDFQYYKPAATTGQGDRLAPATRPMTAPTPAPAPAPGGVR
jgi:PRC-barrel domain protein